MQEFPTVRREGGSINWTGNPGTVQVGTASSIKWPVQLSLSERARLISQQVTDYHGRLLTSLKEYKAGGILVRKPCELTWPELCHALCFLESSYWDQALHSAKEKTTGPFIAIPVGMYCSCSGRQKTPVCPHGEQLT